jgi:hypothetical protein
MTTKGEILKHNWNSINKSQGVEREIRIAFQNNSRNLEEEDYKWYLKHLWDKGG